jgi:hypothetical protein
MLPATWEDVVSTSGDSPVTVRLSASVATLRMNPRVAF